MPWTRAFDRYGGHIQVHQAKRPAEIGPLFTWFLEIQSQWKGGTMLLNRHFNSSKPRLKWGLHGYISRMGGFTLVLV